MRTLNHIGLAVGVIGALTVIPTRNAEAQEASKQWLDPPPQRAHNAGFAVATVQWAVEFCGGSMGSFFKDAMTIFGRQNMRMFNLGHEEGRTAIREVAVEKGKDQTCRVVDALYGDKGEAMADGWISPKRRSAR